MYPLNCRPALALALVAVLLMLAAVRPAAADGFQTIAPFALVEDYDSGAILFEKNAEEPMIPASTTKMLTAEIIFHELKEGRLHLDDKFLVSENAWRTGGPISLGSAMFLEVHSQVRIEDLIRGLVIQSGTDSAIALAEGLAGTEETFTELMNKRAAKLGMNHSHFTNPWGRPDPAQRVTARDMALLAAHIIREYPEYYKYFAEKEFTWNKIRQLNRNPLLTMDMGADGLKTGDTVESGFGLVGSAVQNGHRLIVVVNGLKTARERAEEARKLFNWGFVGLAQPPAPPSAQPPATLTSVVAATNPGPISTPIVAPPPVVAIASPAFPIAAPPEAKPPAPPIPVAITERRVALVIGNSSYPNAVLANPVFDADLVSASLRKVGFEVMEVKDADFAKFDAALTRFVAKEEGSDIALFYFAGHGFALAGDDLRPRNYLMTTSANMSATSDAVLRRDGVSIDEVMKRISAPAKVTLAFIDACRNDPFHRGAADRGFEPIAVSLSRQIYIGMSTHLGKTSIDGVGGMGSPFAQAFVEKMMTPGLRIDDAFRALRKEVSQKTDGKQEPEVLQDDLEQGALVLVRSQ